VSAIPPPTVLEIVKKTTDFLQGKGVESPRLNAEILIGHALGLKRMQLYLQFERALAEPELEKIRPLVRRRGQREPVQYIVGETDFCGVKLKVDRRALIPRPETELLVELVTGRHAAPPARALDLGTGTGAIALALAKAWPEAAITAIDASAEALALARGNAAAIGCESRVTFLQSDWFAQLPVDSRFEAIVANPPYLSDEELTEALPEVRDFEPPQALTALEGGLAALRAIMGEAPRFLAPGGLLALETGLTHHAELAELAKIAGFSRVESLQDLTGRERFVLAWQA
jgi:release factor glutamine methyltransferase